MYSLPSTIVINKKHITDRNLIWRLINRLLAMGFTKWHEEALSIAAQKYKMKGAIRRWQLQKLSAAWNQWMARAQSLARCEAIMSQSVMSWKMRDMVKGFNQWRSVAYFWRLAQSEAEQAMRKKVLETYPTEVYSPSAHKQLTAPVDSPKEPERFSW